MIRQTVKAHGPDEIFGRDRRPYMTMPEIQSFVRPVLGMTYSFLFLTSIRAIQMVAKIITPAPTHVQISVC